MTVILHQFPQSHFCIRVRYALAHKGIRFDVKNYRLQNLDDLQKLTGGYRKVPVLQWDNQYICDSPQIARFLEKQVPEPKLYPGQVTPAQCDMILGWLDGRVMLTAAKWLVGEYLKYLGNAEDVAAYRKIFRTVHGMEPEAAMEKHSDLGQELHQHWRLLEEQLTENSYILGEHRSYADLGVASRLRLMNMVAAYQLPAEFPRARAWYQGISALCE